MRKVTRPQSKDITLVKESISLPPDLIEERVVRERMNSPQSSRSSKSNSIKCYLESNDGCYGPAGNTLVFNSKSSAKRTRNKLNKELGKEFWKIVKLKEPQKTFNFEDDEGTMYLGGFPLC